MPVRQTRQSIGAIVEDAVDRLDQYTWSRMAGRSGSGVHAGYFDGAQPFTGGDSIHSNNYLIPTEATLADIGGFLDVRLLTTDTDHQMPVFLRIRQVGLKDVRGKVALLMPLMMEVSTAFSSLNSRSMEVIQQIHGMRPDGQWIGLDHAVENRDDKTKSFLTPETFALYCGVQFTNSFWWQVYIGKPGKPKIRIPTDPLGAMAIFKDRDKPEEGRRSPLKHWVDEHWMQMRTDPTATTFVRTHLRGTTEFIWHGYECRLVPAEKEQAVADLAATERSHLRDEGRDRKGIGESVEIDRPWWYKVWLRIRQSK